jgi:hypothetical protein
MPRAEVSHWPSPARLVAIGLVASLCAGALLPVAAVAVTAIAQFSDTLESDTREQLVGLYSTEFESGEPAMVWQIARLPCKAAHDRFLATEASIDSAQTVSSEASIQMLSVKLPRGVRCGVKLPLEITRRSMTIAVAPVQANGSAGPPELSYSNSRVRLESFSACMTLSNLCPGRYLLTAQFISPSISSRPVVLAYDFTIATEGATRGAQRAGARKIRLCPIP